MFSRVFLYRVPVLCVAAVLLTSGGLYAQTGTGVVRGTVLDASRATVPKAKITLVNQTTAVSRLSETSEVGIYYFGSVPPGPYTLTVEMSGFKKWNGTLILEAGQTATIEPVMEVGSVDAVVEVTGAAPVITTESSEIGDVKDAQRIRQLPLDGRSIATLFDLTPGVEGGGAPRVNGLKVGSAEMMLDGISLVDRFGGGLRGGVSPGLDTVQEFRIETAGSNAQYSRPATVTLVTKSGTNQLHGSLFETFRNNGGGLRARQRQDGNTPALLIRNEFGASAGGPVYIPKLYDGRNRTFWFGAYEGLRQRQKSFYSDVVPTVEMWRGDFNGVIDSNNRRTAIYDPLTTNATGTRTPFAGNIIPRARIAPILGVMESVTHLPTDNINPYQGQNLREFYPLNINSNTFTGRGDHKLSDKDSLSGRLTRTVLARKQFGGVFGAPRADISNGFGTGRTDAKIYNAYIRETHIFSPYMFTETMLAVNRAPKSSGTLADFTDWPQQLGFPNPFGARGWPSLYTDNFGWDADNRKDEKLTGHVLENNSTWIRGRHTVKFGGRIRLEYNNIQELQQSQGSHDFSGDWTALYDSASDNAVPFTGDGLAAMALGLPTYLSNQYNRGFFYFEQKEAGLYVQDTWKVNSRLTLDLGLRWDLWTAYREKYNRLVNVDLRNFTNRFEVITPGSSTMESLPGVPPAVLQSWAKRGLTWRTADQAGLPSNLLAGDHNNFGPRIGGAYRLNDRTVLRANYGEYYWTLPLSQILQASRQNPPLNLRFENNISTIDGTPTFAVRTAPRPDVFVGRVTVNTQGVVDLPLTARPMVPLDAFNWKDAHARTWHFTFERELMKDTALRLSYIGTQGRDLEQKFAVNVREAEFNYVARTGQNPPGNRDLMRQNSNWGFGSATNRTGFSNTHNLQAEVERRFSQGLQFQVFYVFSRSLTTSDAGGFTSGNGSINSTNGIFEVPENSQLLGGGNSSYDQRLRLGYQNSTEVPPQHLRYNAFYELPFGKGKKFANGASRGLNALAGGWSIALNGDWRGGRWMGITPSRYLFGDPTLSEDQRLQMTFAGRPQRLWFRGDFDPRLATNVDQQALQALIPLNQGDRVARQLGPAFNNRLPQTLANGTVRQTPITDTVNWNARSFFRGPGAWNTDVRLLKSFFFGEQRRVDLSGDFFNMFNHPVDVNPNATTGLQDLSVQANGPRIIQLSLRVSF
ncbi:MAG: TonB-dependent receptor [Bryobacterales bacterium]|nr:TonB-dependent receptor [Bryobacterales bacterium]